MTAEIFRETADPLGNTLTLMGVRLIVELRETILPLVLGTLTFAFPCHQCKTIVRGGLPHDGTRLPPSFQGCWSIYLVLAAAGVAVCGTS